MTLRALARPRRTGKVVVEKVIKQSKELGILPGDIVLKVAGAAVADKKASVAFEFGQRAADMRH